MEYPLFSELGAAIAWVLIIIWFWRTFDFQPRIFCGDWKDKGERCIVCGRLATILDRQRGGMVCREHSALRQQSE